MHGVVPAILVTLIACGHRDDAPAITTATPAPSAPPARANAPTPDAPPQPPDFAVQNLDAMLDEINAGWRKDHEKILVPKLRAGFEVSEDNGVPILIPKVDLRLAEIAKHLAQRTTVKNAGLKPYTDGTLVPLDPIGGKVSSDPIVLALNETLIIFLTPSWKDPKLLGRIDVAKP